MPRVAVVGLGYIGLPTAAIVARAGAAVLGVDVDRAVVDTIARGDIHIEETGLEAVVREVVASGRLVALTTLAPCDVHLIAVPTPFKDGHAPDLAYVLAAARAIAPVLRAGDTVILESTSPVGATEQVRDLIGELRTDLAMPRAGEAAADIAIAYCPERVLPGKILQELIRNDRVIGGITPACAERAADFYRLFVEGQCVITNARAAEFCKLVENSFRDVNIAFANELSIIADTLGLDVWEVIRLANRHPRVAILQPGPGVGGHCIAVDPWFIVDSDPANARLIRAAREVNDGKSDYVVARSSALIDERPSGAVACLGVAFKPDIDDFRQSPALKVAEALARRYGDRIRVVEPHASTLPGALGDSGARLVDLDEALTTCDTLIVLVDHAEFKAVPREARAGKAVYDTRGMWRDADEIV